MVCITETLEVNYFTLAQKLERVTHIRVVNESEEVVVSCTSLLLCCQILGKVGEQVAKVVATAVEQPQPEQPEESKGGCGSSIVGIGAAVTLLGAAAIVTMKKKED